MAKKMAGKRDLSTGTGSHGQWDSQTFPSRRAAEPLTEDELQAMARSHPPDNEDKVRSLRLGSTSKDKQDEHPKKERNEADLSEPSPLADTEDEGKAHIS